MLIQKGILNKPEIASFRELINKGRRHGTAALVGSRHQNRGWQAESNRHDA